MAYEWICYEKKKNKNNPIVETRVCTIVWNIFACCSLSQLYDINSSATNNCISKRQYTKLCKSTVITASFGSTEAFSKEPFHFLGTPHEDHILNSCLMHTVWRHTQLFNMSLKSDWLSLKMHMIADEHRQCEDDTSLVLKKDNSTVVANINESFSYRAGQDEVSFRAPLYVFFFKTIVTNHWVHFTSEISAVT